MKRTSPFIRLQISDDSKDSLARESRRHNLSQTELASLLVEWLVIQPPVVQATVLNNIKNDMEDQLAEMLRSLAASKGLVNESGEVTVRPAGPPARSSPAGRKPRKAAAK